MKPSPHKGKGAKSKKPVVSRSLEQLEAERRERLLDSLKKKFKATLRHMDEVQRVNEEYYQARKELSKAGQSTIHQDKPRKKER